MNLETENGADARLAFEPLVRLFRWVACKIGLHTWRSHGGNVESDTYRQITIIWIECEHCGKSRLAGIWHNGQPLA
jgi:hypothetical protein